MKTIEIRDLADPLPEIAAALRRELRGAGVQGVGVGRRRREKLPGAPLEDEVVLKVVLRRKRKVLPKGARRVPRKVWIAFAFLGQRVRLAVPTDVEQEVCAEPTKYEVGPLSSGSLCLACYARWEEGGATRFGGLTAAHGLWPSPSAAQPVGVVPVQLGASCPVASIDAAVRCASHLARDGVDAALLEFPPDPSGGLHACLTRFYKEAVGLASAADLTRLLGGAGDLLDLPAQFRHFDIDPAGLATVAYFPERKIPVAGWGTVTLVGAVESEGLAGTFLSGTSGAGIVSRPPERHALGIQSLCLDPGPASSANRRSLATSFDAALAWIRGATGLGVEIFWKP